MAISQVLNSEVDLIALVEEKDKLTVEINQIKQWFAATWLPMNDVALIAQRDNYKDKTARINEINQIIINH